MAATSSNYKMSKLTKTWLAFGSVRLPAERASQIRRALISADAAASAPVRSNRREDSKK